MKEYSGTRKLIGIIGTGIFANVLCLVSAALAIFATLYSDVPLTSVMLLMTLPTIVGAFIALVAAPIADKIGYKTFAVVCMLIGLAGCIIPFFVTDFNTILATRAFFGLSYGAAMVIPQTVASKTYAPEENAKYQGIIQSSMAGSAVVGMLAGGVIAAQGLTMVWIAQVIWVSVSLIMCAWGLPQCKAAKDASTSDGDTQMDAARAGGETSKAGAFPVAYWLVVLFAGCNMMFFYPINVNTSVLLAENGFGTDIAGYVLALVQAAGFFGGLVYGKVESKIGKVTIGISMLLCGGACLLCATAGGNAILYFIAAIVIGPMFYWGNSWGYSFAAKCMNPKSAAISMSVLGFVVSAVPFISAYAVNGIEAIVGLEPSAGNNILVGGIALIVCSILFLATCKLVKPFSEK